MPRVSKKTISKKPAVTRPVRRGLIVGGSGPQAGGFLYHNPRFFPFNNRPHLYTIADTYKAVSSGIRNDQVKYARELFATMPDLGNSIISKNHWSFSDGWLPRFRGSNTAWGEAAADWLKNVWFPQCNLLGPNYDFRTSLFLSGVALDVDGDSLCIY